MQWQFVEPIENEAIIETFWNLLDVPIPPAIQSTIIAYNGGAPERDLFVRRVVKSIKLGIFSRTMPRVASAMIKHRRYCWSCVHSWGY